MYADFVREIAMNAFWVNVFFGFARSAGPRDGKGGQRIAVGRLVLPAERVNILLGKSNLESRLSDAFESATNAQPCLGFSQLPLLA